jgi:peptidoglycan/LPS O-acetylase OafA/YrhL
MHPQHTHKIIPSLNGLRALSIIMVILSHLKANCFLPENYFFRYAGMIICNGALGVTIFFIISGFLITTLLIKEREKNGFIFLKKFYARRIIRIFPAYYFLLFVYFILTQLNYAEISTTSWIAALFYLRQFYPIYEHLIGHLWSLSVEESFYVFFPLLFISVKKNLNTILIVLIVMVTIGRLFLFEHPVPALSQTIVSSADSLLVGCLIAVNYDLLVLIINKITIIKYIAPIILVTSILGNYYIYHIYGYGNDAGIYVSASGYAFFGDLGLVTNLCIAVVILTSITQEDYWFRFLNTRALNYIGVLSYSIYLWQQLFTDDRPYLHKIPVIVIFAIIFACAIISYYCIEKPFLKLKRHFETS